MARNEACRSISSLEIFKILSKAFLALKQEDLTQNQIGLLLMIITWMVFVLQCRRYPNLKINPVFPCNHYKHELNIIRVTRNIKDNYL